MICSSESFPIKLIDNNIFLSTFWVMSPVIAWNAPFYFWQWNWQQNRCQGQLADPHKVSRVNSTQMCCEVIFADGEIFETPARGNLQWFSTTVAMCKQQKKSMCFEWRIIIAMLCALFKNPTLLCISSFVLNAYDSEKVFSYLALFSFKPSFWTWVNVSHLQFKKGV